MLELLQSLEFWTVVVAVLALIVSIVAHIRSGRLDARLLELEEERESDRLQARQSAKLRAELIGDSRSHIRIENNGAAEARNIRGTLDGQPLQDHTCTKGYYEPIQSVGSQSFTRLPMTIGMKKAASPPFDLELLWDDEAGSDHSYRTTLR